jgi:endonuclease I
LLLSRALGALLIALALVATGFARPAVGQVALQQSVAQQSVAQQSIYPGLEGAELREAIRQDYSPSQTLGYDAARDVLFEYLNDTRGELRGVYTGYAITLDPDEDPTQDAFSKGINTEHTWPQSKGAGEEPARSDMHALYPTREGVNSARSNHPYAEIPDSETDGWYRLSQSQSTIPSSTISEWSEKDNENPDAGYDGRFEPREDHKGNAARAATYFYVIYETEADIADPEFMDVQRDVLLDWHDQDAVDPLEYDRSQFIKAQQGAANPFVLDTTLVRRALMDLPSGDGGGDAGTGAVIISEIMANPDDVSDADGEWFEVYNPGSVDVDMNGWTISDNDDDDALITESVIVPAGGFAVLCKNDDEAANGGIACDYDFVSDSSPNDFYIANGADELVLSSGGRTEIDRVEYDRGGDWPGQTGASMVYLDAPEGNNNTAAAWDNATAREGRYDDPGSDLGSPGVNGTGPVLPVEIVRFTARRDGEAVRLTWATASETKNAGFGVERSVDGSAFEQVAYLAGAGTTTRSQTYRHVDRGVPFTAERIRYRLRQVDYDGAVTYWGEVEVRRGGAGAFALHPPHPNPASGAVTIRYELAERQKVRLEAYDAAGRRVQTLIRRWQAAGRNEVTFDAGGLASGVYVIRLRAGGRAKAQTVIVLR